MCPGPPIPSSSNIRPRPGPYRIALANGFIANTWRIQMIKTAKAYAAQPDVAAKLKEFKVVSTGEDVAAQIAAINNFIDSGYDAIVVNAQNPKAFGPVIKRAKAAGVILVAFDNILDTTDAINVDVDQKGLGVLWANWLIKHIPNGGKILEVRGVAGTSVDTDRHNGIHETLDASGKKWDVVEVVGKWDDPTAQKATADAIAVQKHFDGFTAQGGDTGVVQAMIDAGHPFVPFGGETENGFRKFCGAHAKDGLVCSSAGTGPAQVAVAIKTAIDALDGKVVPQSVKLPLAIVEDPDFKDGVNYYSTQSDNSSSAIPSRPAASISPPRKSWDSPKPISNISQVRNLGAGGNPRRFYEDDGRMEEQRRFSAWKASPSAMAVSGRWRRPSSPSMRAASMPCWARTAPANRPSSRSWPGWWRRTRAA
jgi:ABC-type sugar transport system, periplasmic component